MRLRHKMMRSGTMPLTPVRHFPSIAAAAGGRALEEEHMASRKALLAASVLTVGAVAIPASARNAADAMPGNPAVSCRVTSRAAG